MSTITKRLTVDQYDQMVENGILPETNRFELINGRIVEKDVKDPVHPTVVDLSRRALERILPAGWYVRKEDPVRIPNRRSEPEPDLAVVRGTIEDYATRHPSPDDVALVVEVTRSSVTKDRALARVYGGGGIQPIGSSTFRGASSKSTKVRPGGDIRLARSSVRRTPCP